jgi:tetratricopeptide (TPR) repeat protein
VRSLTGDNAGAIADFDVALKLRPRDGASLYSRGLVLLRTGQAERAIADFDAAIKVNPKDFRCRGGGGRP